MAIGYFPHAGVYVFALYALIIILPISGMAAWGSGVTGAIRVRLLAKTMLLPLIGLKRMLVPTR